MIGWIKIYRKIQDHWLYDSKRPKTKLEAWIHILLTVNFKPSRSLIRGIVYECDRGQSLFSLQTWAKEFNWSIQSVRTFFIQLEKDEMITTEGLQYTTRLTVCNYDLYQYDLTDEQQANQQTANKPLTDGQQTANIPLTTIEESKEGNKVKKKESKEEEPEKIPAPPKPDFIDSIISLFSEEYSNANNFPYRLTSKEKERKGAGKILLVHKEENPEMNSDQTLESLRLFFRACVHIQDNWHQNKMSLSHIASNFNEIRKIALNGGKKGDGVTDLQLIRIFQKKGIIPQDLTTQDLTKTFNDPQ